MTEVRDVRWSRTVKTFISVGSNVIEEDESSHQRRQVIRAGSYPSRHFSLFPSNRIPQTSSLEADLLATNSSAPQADEPPQPKQSKREKETSSGTQGSSAAFTNQIRQHFLLNKHCQDDEDYLCPPCSFRIGFCLCSFANRCVEHSVVW